MELWLQGPDMVGMRTDTELPARGGGEVHVCMGMLSCPAKLLGTEALPAVVKASMGRASWCPELLPPPGALQQL
jgi:hypothetical protein